MRSGRLVLKIYLYSLLIIVITGAVQVAFFATVRSERNEAFAHMSEHFVADLAAHYDDPAALGEEIARLRHAKLQMSVYDPEGNLKVSTVTPPLKPLPSHELAELDAPRPVQRGDVFYAHPIRQDGRLVAVAIIGFPQRSLASIIVSAGIILGILVMIGLLFARHLARPLQRIATAAQRFGRGELSARAQISSDDEIGAVGRAFDEMADRVTHLMTAQQELMANVSHELQTPLSRMQVAVDLLTDGIADQAKELLPEIAQDLAELERLIDDVMMVARFDLSRADGRSTGTPLRKSNVCVDELVQKAASRFRTQHQSHELVVEVAPDLPELCADPVLLRRVVENLVDNARKYSEPGSVIRLAAFARGAGVAIEVSDHGIGMDADDLKQLFTPFFRSDRSRSRATGGVGLGLVLARRVVEAHRGTIDVESVPGQSTTVRLELPAT